MGVYLKPIDEDNFLDVFNLKLREGQDNYVSHPIRSLAQAYVYRTQCQPFGIFADERAVGYVMVIYDYDIPEYDIWHMMIDSSQQGKGYGRAALALVLDYIGQKPFGDSNRVALTGIGIPKDSQSRVFERFYRVDKGRSKKSGGTGLGLAIVKHIAMLYNAEISLKSEENIGTVITVCFPEKSEA